MAGVAVAAPAASQPAPPPPPATGSGSGAGSGSGSAAAPDDGPPGDMNGTDENPDGPKTGFTDKPVVVAPKPSVRVGYPTEETLRPITLPQNMSEVSIGPHFEFSDDSRQGYAGGDALRARYGITRQVQLGLTYVFAAIYHDPAGATATTTGNLALHSGKAVGLDVTVLLENWLAVRVGVPVYVSPVAVSLELGAPIKFVFGKLALGGLENLLNIKLDRFAPSFYQEYDNALAAFETQTGGNNTQQAGGYLNISGFVEYQQAPDLVILGRIGEQSGLGGGGGGTAGTSTPGATETYLRGGLQWTPRNWIDVGFTLGFDDLAHLGTFGPAGILAVRI
nr:hypothetical protein [Kofleriaceae bacterium]